MDIISNHVQLTLTTYQPDVGPYRVKYTDITNLPNIIIKKGDVNTTSVDVALFGRLKIEYGELLNESLLHIVENFNCPQDLTIEDLVTPDLTRVINNLLRNPVDGQLWYNSSDEHIYFWNGQYWVKITEVNDIAAAYGTILDGEQIPLPVSPNGIEYTYADCIWVISPNEYPSSHTYMECNTDQEANVTIQYILEGDLTATSGTANYLIVAIDGNVNLGSREPPEPPHENPSIDIVSTSGNLGLISFDTLIFIGSDYNIVSTFGELTINSIHSVVTVGNIVVIVSSTAPNLHIASIHSTVNKLESINISSSNTGILIVTSNDSSVFSGSNINIVTSGYGTIVIEEVMSDVVWVDPIGRVACPIYPSPTLWFYYSELGPHYIGSFRDDGLLHYTAFNSVPPGGLVDATIPWIKDVLLPTPFDLTQYTWTVIQKINPTSTTGPTIRWYVNGVGLTEIQPYVGLTGTMAQQPNFIMRVDSFAPLPNINDILYQGGTIQLSIVGPGIDNECSSVQLSPIITYKALGDTITWNATPLNIYATSESAPSPSVGIRFLNDGNTQIDEGNGWENLDLHDWLDQGGLLNGANFEMKWINLSEPENGYGPSIPGAQNTWINMGSTRALEINGVEDQGGTAGSVTITIRKVGTLTEFTKVVSFESEII